MEVVVVKDGGREEVDYRGQTNLGGARDDNMVGIECIDVVDGQWIKQAEC